MIKKCSNCYFGDKCGCGEICDDYAPLIDELTDEEVSKMVEIGRVAFYDAWIEYISEYED